MGQVVSMGAAASMRGTLSNEELLQGIDPRNTHSLSPTKKYCVENQLRLKLVNSVGRLRSVFKGISPSDYNNLRDFVAKHAEMPAYSYGFSLWRPLLQELQSMEDEICGQKSPNHSSELQHHYQVSESSKPIPRSNENDPVLIPLPIPPAKTADGSCNNSGVQNLKGLINQTGYVSGIGNGSIIYMHECKLSLRKD